MRLPYNLFLLLSSAILIAPLPVRAGSPEKAKPVSPDKAKPVSPDKANPVSPEKAKPGSPDKAKQGWQLSYKVNALGRVDCLLSEDGAKLTTPMFSLLVLPPDYHAVLFNPQTRKMISIKKEKVPQTFAMFGDRGPSQKFKFTPWLRQHDEKILGLVCSKFHRELENPGSSKDMSTRFADDFWVTNAIDVRNYKQLMEPLVAIARGSYKQLVGIPVRHKKSYEEFYKGSKKPYHSEITNSLSLISADKIQIKPSMYSVPKDYKIVADETELLFSDEQGGDGNVQNFGRH